MINDYDQSYANDHLEYTASEEDGDDMGDGGDEEMDILSPHTFEPRFWLWR